MDTSLIHKLDSYFLKVGIVLICGCPAAGKSTLCQRIVSYMCEDKGNILTIWIDFDVEIGIIPYDVILENNNTYKKLRENIHNKLDQIIYGILSLSAIGQYTLKQIVDIVMDHFPQSIINNNENYDQKLESIIIILDDTFHYKSMRYTIYQLTTKYDIGFIQLYMDCSKDLLLDRNSQRNILLNSRGSQQKNIHQVSNSCILKLNKIFEIPSTSNKWENNTIAINVQYNNIHNWINELIKKLRMICHQGKIPIVDDKEVDNSQSFSLLHEIDCILRSFVSEKVKESHDKKQGVYINSIKNELYNKIKTNHDLYDQIEKLRQDSIDRYKHYMLYLFDLHYTNKQYDNLSL